MYKVSKSNSFLLIILVFSVLSLVSPSLTYACTYEATIHNHHLDLNITSDKNNVQLVQLMYKQGASGSPFTITNLYGPNPIPWTMYNDNEQTYSGYSMVIQNRQQYADAAYWVGWLDSEHYNLIPAGIYGVDFTGVMNLSDISLEYGTMDAQGNTNTVGEPWTFCQRTGDIGSSTTPSPSPSPIPSLTPSPTPSSTLSVSKVFFLPGLGGSWNLNSFANCTFDNNPNNWTLAAYAESVYNPILTALKNSGWDTTPIYYDWKQEIKTNSNAISAFINNKTGQNEKINLAGHSLGGLIARDYSEQGVNKLNKLLTIGSPHMGAVQTYPAWSAGDIWEDNFLQKVAMTLYLKHCGGVFGNSKNAVHESFPVVNNLLPIFNYIKNLKTERYKDYTTMDNKNSWHINNVFSAGNFDTETISGYGFNTLSSIQVKEPSKREVSAGLWTDGKAAGKEMSFDGDGTVLLKSAQLPGIKNIILNQDHIGLVNSVDGMTEILKFFEKTPFNISATQNQDTSALILISDALNFSITDSSGNTKNNKNGMIAVTNPKHEDYNLNILPKNNNTLFVVAQFLPNGQVFYKEYIFKGFNPQFKKINFDPNNTSEDLLN